ncbi:MAG TPA: alpha/beta hydrolase [Jatrophihabitans sp.]
MRRALLVLPVVTGLLLAACAHTTNGTPVGSTLPSSPTSSSSSDSGRPTSPAPSSGDPSSPGATATPSVDPITFGSCNSIFTPSDVPAPDGLDGKISFGCAQLPVPLNYTDASGRSINLQLLRIHDKDATPIGSLLVNPGGPGASGIELALGILSELDPSLLKNFDIIGFDPRGVGLSSPINCISNSLKDQYNAYSPDVRQQADFDQAKKLAKQVADGCASKYGTSLPFINTVNTARDMDLIRQAVGDERMNYLGFSYGTELGSVYAHLFPGKVRVAVLDGAVDPLTDDIQQFADQLDGFEKSFDQFSDNCGTGCASLGDPRQAVYDIVTKANTKPLSTGSSRVLTSSLALTGVLQALYSSSYWPDLASALKKAKNGDGSGLLDLADQYNERDADGSYSNIIDANLTISCNDSDPGPTDQKIKDTAAQWATKYPMFGIWAAGSLASCQQWQPTRTPPPLPTADNTANKVLVIGNLNDPATPYQGAVDLAKTMGNAEVLTWDGEGHTSYLEGSSCIDDAVNKYLIDVTLPPPDTTCPRN